MYECNVLSRIIIDVAVLHNYFAAFFCDKDQKGNFQVAVESSCKFAAIIELDLSYGVYSIPMGDAKIQRQITKTQCFYRENCILSGCVKHAVSENMRSRFLYPAGRYVKVKAVRGRGCPCDK